MVFLSSAFHRFRRGSGTGLQREIWLLSIGLFAGIIGAWLTHPTGSTVLLTIAATLMVMVILLFLDRQSVWIYRKWLVVRLRFVLKSDPAACIVTERNGQIGYLNTAAENSFGVGHTHLSSCLRSKFAYPDTAINRLRDRATRTRAVQEDLQTIDGALRVSVHKVGLWHYLWRVENLPSQDADAAEMPQVLLSPGGTVIKVNAALKTLLGASPNDLSRIIVDLPLRPGDCHEVMTPRGIIRCFVAVRDLTGGAKSVFVLPMITNGVAHQDVGAFDILPIALLRLSFDGTVIAANRVASCLLGGEVPPGTNLADLFEGLGRPVPDWVADARSGRMDRRPEVMRRRGQADEVFMQVTLSRAVVDGNPEFVAVLTDATQLKTLEAQFVQAQKMQAIGQLAGGGAHDFNNLLTAISGHCDLLMLRRNCSDAEYADLDQISQNANRAAALVRQLLAFSRKQTMNARVMDLGDTVSDLTHLLNRLVGEKITLTLMMDPDLRPIRADKRQLEQVIMNLVVNARDAMPMGGEVRIETENLTLHAAQARDRVTLPAGNYVQVKVIDEGVGMTPDVRAKIFEPFFTTKRTGEGTGLGLSTVYGIVKQTGAYIFCDSDPGQGTTFTIFLPAYDQDVDVPEPAVPTVGMMETGAATATILLVEDEAPVRAFAARALKLRGYTVLEAECAEDALGMLDDPALGVDVFVTDVVMPGMDGPSWVAKALEQRPETAVVFMSGYAEDAFSKGLPPIPNSAFLPKPFSLSELVATVQQRLGQQRLGST